ncbi:MAG: class I SAM-dependent methyltransferase [Ruminococcus sp.]|nr:class I SAM-dependent methyltransferase [Ruminococcus sp.]
MNEEKFTGKADLYDKYRPAYPAELINWLYEKTRADAAADIGAGTGIFTKCLSAKSWKITAVEPNADMLERLRENLPDIEAVNAPAEDTGIASGSIGLVTAAQAFHWFDAAKFKAECKRIFAPDGRLAIIWNTRTDTDMQRERSDIFNRYGRQRNAGKNDLSRSDGKFAPEKYFSEYEEISFLQTMTMDMEQYVGCEMSRSYAPERGTAAYEVQAAEMQRLFEKYQQGGRVDIPYTTECFFGKF